MKQTVKEVWMRTHGRQAYCGAMWRLCPHQLPQAIEEELF